jgi:Tfp pilus assembly protein PilF
MLFRSSTLSECLSFDMKPEERIAVLSNLGICSVKLKQYEDARDYLLQACKEGVTREWEGHVHFYLALSCAHLNLLQESKREFQLCEEKAAEYQLPLAQVYAWMSKICKELGEKDESERYSQMAPHLMTSKNQQYGQRQRAGKVSVSSC